MIISPTRKPGINVPGEADDLFFLSDRLYFHDDELCLNRQCQPSAYDKI